LDELTSIAQRIFELRESRRWSQAELARRANVSRVTINHIENGSIERPQRLTLRRLARALDTTPDALIGKEALSNPLVHDLLRCPGVAEFREEITKHRATLLLPKWLLDVGVLLVEKGVEVLPSEVRRVSEDRKELEEKLEQLIGDLREKLQETGKINRRNAQLMLEALNNVRSDFKRDIRRESAKKLFVLEEIRDRPELRARLAEGLARDLQSEVEHFLEEGLLKEKVTEEFR